MEFASGFVFQILRLSASGLLSGRTRSGFLILTFFSQKSLVYLIGQMSSFKIFILWVAFCFAKNRLFRVPLSLHSFATLRNWLRQPLQSLPRPKGEAGRARPRAQVNKRVFARKLAGVGRSPIPVILATV